VDFLTSRTTRWFGKEPYVTGCNPLVAPQFALHQAAFPKVSDWIHLHRIQSAFPRDTSLIEPWCDRTRRWPSAQILYYTFRLHSAMREIEASNAYWLSLRVAVLVAVLDLKRPESSTSLWHASASLVDVHVTFSISISLLDIVDTLVTLVYP
jgi:hypothetical protein